MLGIVLFLLGLVHDGQDCSHFDSVLTKLRHRLGLSIRQRLHRLAHFFASFFGLCEFFFEGLGGIQADLGFDGAASVPLGFQLRYFLLDLVFLSIRYEWINQLVATACRLFSDLTLQSLRVDHFLFGLLGQIAQVGLTYLVHTAAAFLVRILQELRL